jgi:hypothetical protein
MSAAHDEFVAQRLESGGKAFSRGWNAQNLQRLRKADPEKLKIAARLLTETTLTLKWIAHLPPEQQRRPF